MRIFLLIVLVGIAACSTVATQERQNVTDPSGVNLIEKRFSQRIEASADNVVPHKLIRSAVPEYSKKMRAAGAEGLVALRYDINKRGRVDNIEVIGSEPGGMFENSAIAAAKKWKFIPASIDQRPITTKGVVSLLTFCLEDEDSEVMEPTCVGKDQRARFIRSLPVREIEYEQ